MIIHVKTFMNSTVSYRGDLILNEEATLADALAALGLSEHLELQGEQLIFLINSKTAELNSQLRNGDELMILQSMMGG